MTLGHVDQVKAIAKQYSLDVIVAMTTNGVASIFPLALSDLDTAFVFSEHNQPDFYVEQWWGIGRNFTAKMAMRGSSTPVCPESSCIARILRPPDLLEAEKVQVIPQPGRTHRAQSLGSRRQSIGSIHQHRTPQPRKGA